MYEIFSYKPNPNHNLYTHHIFPLVFLGLAALIWILLDLSSGRHLVLFIYFAFVAGAIWELSLLTSSWKASVSFHLLILILASFGAMIISFLGSDSNADNVAGFVDIAFYIFAIVSFQLIFLLFSGKFTANINEGHAFAYTLILFYFLIENSPSTGSFLGSYILYLIVLLLFSPFLIFSTVHVFTYINITPRDQLSLSIWSSVVLVILGVIYVLSVLNLHPISSKEEINLYMAVSTYMEFFFLAAASGYIAQNLTMVKRYVPDTNRIFEKKYLRKLYFQDIVRLNEMHVKRFSNSQTPKHRAAIYTTISMSLMISNYWLKLCSPELIVWVCLILTPAVFGNRDNRGAAGTQELVHPNSNRLIK